MATRTRRQIQRISSVKTEDVNSSLRDASNQVEEVHVRVDDVVERIDGIDVLTTRGDVLYHDGTDYQRLAKGAARTLLQVNAGATAPEWTNAIDAATAQIDTSLTVGTSAASVAVAEFVGGSTAWSPSSIAAGGVETKTIPIDATASLTGRPFVVGVPTAWSSAIIYTARGTDTNEVTMYAHNPTAGAIDPGSSATVYVFGVIW